jgi:hypothetical protein
MTFQRSISSSSGYVFRLILGDFFFGLFFVPEDGGATYIRNVISPELHGVTTHKIVPSTVTAKNLISRTGIDRNSAVQVY